jgi:hypothetical protein
MKRYLVIKKIEYNKFFILMILTTSGWGYSGLKQDHTYINKQTFQAQAVLTVSESKRLIAKAIAQSSFVQSALEEGMVIITKGTTTTYVAEEILNISITPGSFLLGRTQPAKDDKRLEAERNIDEIIIVNGERRKDITLADAVKDMKPGDVVIKGANALDYKNRMAAGLIGAPNSGTTGTIIPYITASKANLIIPVGLEKEIGSDLVSVVKQMHESLESLNKVPSMYMYTTGQIITEIEALEILSGVSVTHIASGGISGAEGAVRILIRGQEENVKKALDIIEDIQGEPPFVR